MTDKVLVNPTGDDNLKNKLVHYYITEIRVNRENSFIVIPEDEWQFLNKCTHLTNKCHYNKEYVHNIYVIYNIVAFIYAMASTEPSIN